MRRATRSLCVAVWYSGTCPNCGRSDWCQQADTGAYMCRRSPGPGLLERRDRHGVTYWIHLPEGNERRIIARPVTSVNLAEKRDLHQVYATILGRLTLSEAHLQQWQERGVSREVVDRHQVRTWPSSFAERQAIASDLYREFGALCISVPGFYVRDRRPMLSGGRGWVIPLWDLETGLVCALRLRSDMPDGPKYYWLSSAGRRGGASPGVHARLAWPGRMPVREDRADVVRVTEGEAKSIVLAERTGIPTLSLPGVSMWRLALPWLRWLKTRKVLLCFDSDRATKPEVAGAYLAAVRGYQCHGFTVSTETWGVRKSE